MFGVLLLFVGFFFWGRLILLASGWVLEIGLVSYVLTFVAMIVLSPFLTALAMPVHGK